MSNLGIRIIYGILNNIPDVLCERVFAVASDMEDALRKEDRELQSLESGRRLKDFDFIGFSLGYELSYTNVLNILDLGKVPLKAEERDVIDPLVIGGGPCVLNPEPVADFFDLFVIGEGEEVIVEIIDIYRKLKGQFKSLRLKRKDLLLELSRIEGVYVPSLYEVTYTLLGKIGDFKPKIPGVPKKIKKRFVQDLDQAFYPLNWIIPYIETVHDRITIEIMRGCPNHCRFCQARQQYFPFRQRSINNLLNLGSKLYQSTGYDDISLSGLSVSDYKNIEELVKSLIGLFHGKTIGISLPSIKPKAMVGELSSIIAKIKKTGLTFAPEVSTERLRNVIAKDFNLDDFYGALRQAYASGYQHVKLYFMIGIPTEEKEDLDGIIKMASRVSELSREVSRRPAQVNISINTLIPKPHTAFQWFSMLGLDEIKQKQDYLRDKVREYLPAGRQERLKVSCHNRYMTFLEGILSRGDRRLGEVILNAFNSGCRLDAWVDQFKFEKWIAAFETAGIRPDFYLEERQRNEFLPWDFLDIGTSKESLIKEAERAESGNKVLL